MRIERFGGEDPASEAHEAIETAAHRGEYPVSIFNDDCGMLVVVFGGGA